MVRGVDGTDLDRARHGGRQYRTLGKAIRSAEPALAESTVVIVASGIELRAGPRLLLDGATFRIAPGDRVGLVGRNGAGKTTLTKVLAGEGPAGGRHRDAVGRRGLPPAGPAHRRPHHAGPRPHPLRARARHDRPRPAGHREADGLGGRRGPREGDGAVRAARCGVQRPGRVRGGVRGRTDRLGARARRPDPRPAAAHPLRRPAAPGRADPDPLLRRADAAPGRAHEPPRRRLDRLAARLPARPTRVASWSSATTSRCSTRSSTGCSTWTPTGPRWTSTTSAGRPTSRSARPTSGAGSASGRTPRRRPAP